ncbi:hypothetical protein STEG23_002503 [Scotinomys teguina]
MALMAGTVRRHSSALEGEVSRTPQAAIRDSSSALKVSQTSGAAWHSSNDWNCEETQFSPGGRGILDTLKAAIWDSSSALKVSWTPGDFLGKSGLELLQQGVLTVRESQAVPGMMGDGFPAGYGDPAPLLKSC